MARVRRTVCAAGVRLRAQARLAGRRRRRPVNLDDTQVGDEGLRYLSQCPNLKYLSVEHPGDAGGPPGTAQGAAGTPGEPISEGATMRPVLVLVVWLGP